MCRLLTCSKVAQYNVASNCLQSSLHGLTPHLILNLRLMRSPKTYTSGQALKGLPSIHHVPDKQKMGWITARGAQLKKGKCTNLCSNTVINNGYKVNSLSYINR